MATLQDEISRRRTFAIISHPDAGKTTLTEKLLLFGGAIHIAGAVKSNKIKKTATSDWMEIEKQRYHSRRCCQRCRDPDPQADGSVPYAQHPRHNICQ